jgi:DNA primase
MPRFDRDEILARVDLRALLGEFCGPVQGAGVGARWHCPVPDHEDVRPSVSVRVDRRGVERWRCWSLGHGGTAIDVLYHVHNLSYSDAIAHLADRAGVGVDEPRRAVLRQPVERPAVPLQPQGLAYVEACERLLWQPVGRPVLDYLLGRGLEYDVLRVNRVGADPGTGRLRRAGGLPKHGVGAVFPALSVDGQITYFQTRYLDPKPNRSKYANPATRLGDNPHHGWSRPAGPGKQPVVMCEGFPDAYIASSAGYEAIAILGTANANDRLVERLTPALQGRPVILTLDGDAAGRHAAEQLSQSLSKRGIMVIDIPLPSGKDLNSWVHEARSLPDLGRRRPSMICRPESVPAVVVPAP